LSQAVLCRTDLYLANFSGARFESTKLDGAEVLLTVFDDNVMSWVEDLVASGKVEGFL
jgi:uncharacterized protein YjbI with pentapeptide repeats